MIISLVNQKGGVGKTTIAVNIAHYLTEQSADAKVLLIDADPLGGVVKWQGLSKRASFKVVHYPEKSLHKDIDKLCAGYKHVIIDAPPGTGSITVSCLTTSQMVILPVDPSPLAIWSTGKCINAVRQVKRFNTRLESRILISKSVVGTTMERTARELLLPYGLGLFETQIHSRIDFVKSFVKGLSVLQFAPRSKAAAEIVQLCEEIDFDKFETKAILREKPGILEAFKRKIAEKRRQERKERLIPVDFVVQGRAYNGYIQNLSPTGAFVETRVDFSLGQTITMTFELPETRKSIRIGGAIVRKDILGVGIKFERQIELPESSAD